MQRSESIKALSKALVLAKSKMEAPTKDKTNPHFKSKYADLASLKSSYQAALTEAGLSVVSALGLKDSVLTLTTTVVHADTAEFMASDFPIAAGLKAQEIGSAVTYGRRYNVSCLLDIVAEDDDDGNAGNGNGAAPEKSKEEKREATDAKLAERQNEAQRLALECADFSKLNPEEEMFKAAGVKKGSEIKTIKHAESAIQNLMARAKKLEAEGNTPF